MWVRIWGMLPSPHYRGKEQLWDPTSSDTHKEPPQAAHHGLTTCSQTSPLGQPVVPSSILQLPLPQPGLTSTPTLGWALCPLLTHQTLPCPPGCPLFLPSTAPGGTQCVHPHKPLAIQAALTCPHTTLPKVPTSLHMSPVSTGHPTGAPRAPHCLSRTQGDSLTWAGSSPACSPWGPAPQHTHGCSQARTARRILPLHDADACLPQWVLKG